MVGVAGRPGRGSPSLRGVVRRAEPEGEYRQDVDRSDFDRPLAGCSLRVPALATLMAMDDWSAGTWAEVIAASASVLAAIGALIAAAYSASSARSSARAGEHLVLAADHARLDAIRRNLATSPEVEGELRINCFLEVIRLLRSSDDLPLTRAWVERGSGEGDTEGLAEVEAAMEHIEARLRD